MSRNNAKLIGREGGEKSLDMLDSLAD